MTDLAAIKKRYPFNESEDLWQVIALAEHLQAENAQLKAHNRQMVGALEKIKQEAVDGPMMGVGNRTDYALATIKNCNKALQTPHAKLALAEAEVLRAAEYLAANIDNELDDIVDAVEAMQEARKDDH